MEIERKFLVDSKLTPSLSGYPKHEMAQGYISTDPVVRIRRSDEKFILTVKSGGLLSREEFEMFLTEDQFTGLSIHVQGLIIEKTRYLIPCSPYTIELDVFHGALEGLLYAEVEFPSVEEAEAFTPPSWFGREVTEDGSFTNAALSRLGKDEVDAFLKTVLTAVSAD